MHDMESTNVEAAAYLAREDAYDDRERPSASELAEERTPAPRAIPGWTVAPSYRPVPSLDQPDNPF